MQYILLWYILCSAVQCLLGTSSRGGKGASRMRSLYNKVVISPLKLLLESLAAGLNLGFHLFKKSTWLNNIFILVNLELISGFILQIKSIQNYLQGHMVAAMCFNMGHLIKMGWNFKFKF